MAGIRSKELQTLAEDWERWRRGREFPSRADFDPLNLKYILGSLSLIDVVGFPPKFRIRLHASNVVDRAGLDLTGKFVDEMPSERQALALTHYRAVLAQRKPLARTYVDHNIDERLWNCEVLVLPLAGDGNTIDMLMSAFAWNDATE